MVLKLQVQHHMFLFADDFFKAMRTEILNAKLCVRLKWYSILKCS